MLVGRYSAINLFAQMRMLNSLMHMTNQDRKFRRISMISHTDLLDTCDACDWSKDREFDAWLL